MTTRLRRRDATIMAPSRCGGRNSPARRLAVSGIGSFDGCWIFCAWPRQRTDQTRHQIARLSSSFAAQ
jgi:hypothetical protein